MNTTTDDVKHFLNTAQDAIDRKVSARTFLHIIRGALAAKTGFKSNGLKDVTDCAYYQGGYPGKDSPPRMDAYCEKLGSSLSSLAASGDLNAINRKLINYGITINVNSPTLLATEDCKKLDNRLDKAYNDFGYNADIAGFISAVAECGTEEEYVELMELYTTLSVDLQGEICYNADEVKIGLIDDLVSSAKIVNKAAYISAAHELYNLRKKLGDNNQDEDRVIEQVNEKMAKALEREDSISEMRDELALSK